MLTCCYCAVLLWAVPSVQSQAADGTDSKNSPAVYVASQRYKIAVCDWMILKRQKLGAFPLAKDIGADGVEVDMGSLGRRVTFENSLTNPANCALFLDRARELNLAIPSIAMSAFYAQPFGLRTNATQLVQDCLATMKRMNVKVAFLPLGINSDVFLHPELRPAVVERLKLVGRQAEQAGMIIGLDTELDADAQIKLLDDVGSPAVKIYYQLAHAIEHQRDYVAELKKLGKDRVCQIHFSNTDGYWLQNDPQVDARKIKAALDEMGWTGWLVIERSRDTNDVHNVRKNYGANAAYLKSVFQNP
jgi:sugar phosphate isomerase/epimerase